MRGNARRNPELNETRRLKIRIRNFVAKFALSFSSESLEKFGVAKFSRFKNPLAAKNPNLARRCDCLRARQSRVARTSSRDRLHLSRGPIHGAFLHARLETHSNDERLFQGTAGDFVAGRKSKRWRDVDADGRKNPDALQTNRIDRYRRK